MAEDMEEVKKTLNLMSQELSALVKQKGLVKLSAEVRQLRNTIKEKDKNIDELQKRVDDMKHTRTDDLLITPHLCQDYSRRQGGSIKSNQINI